MSHVIWLGSLAGEFLGKFFGAFKAVFHSGTDKSREITGAWLRLATVITKLWLVLSPVLSVTCTVTA